MEKRKENVNENVNMLVENVEEKVEVVEEVSKEMKEKIYLKRSQFEVETGKTYWSYYFDGVILNREVKVTFVPKDNGGYGPLDYAFLAAKNDGEENKVELVVKIVKNGFGSNVTKNNMFMSRYIAKDGMPFECEIKPSKASDLSLLKTLLWSKGIRLV